MNIDIHIHMASKTIMIDIEIYEHLNEWVVGQARRTVAGNIQDVAGARQYIPLKLNSSGVMPIIFAQALMFVPQLLSNSENEVIKSIGSSFQNMFGLCFSSIRPDF